MYTPYEEEQGTSPSRNILFLKSRILVIFSFHSCGCLSVYFMDCLSVYFMGLPVCLFHGIVCLFISWIVSLVYFRLLLTEKVGGVCRDDTVEGLRFFPNLFLTKTS